MTAAHPQATRPKMEPADALTTALAPIDPQSLLATAVDKGASVETLERLVALARDLRTQQAREAWYQAMAEFQRRCPPIHKRAEANIRTAKGSYSYRYAPLDEIMSTIQPVLGELGLSVSWRTRMERDQVVVNCRIAHAFGHTEESGELAMPVTGRADDGMGANAAQRVGIANTYAKRYSLLAVIGLAPEDDDDAAGLDDGPPPRGASRASRAARESREEAPSADDPRHHLLRAITTLADERKLTAPQRGALWRTHIGPSPDPEKADPAALEDLAVAIRAIPVPPESA